VLLEKVYIPPVHRFAPEPYDPDFREILPAGQTFGELPKNCRNGMVNRDSLVDQPLSEPGETFRLQIVRTHRCPVEESGEHIVSAAVDAK
jgi:hypothetical protein